MITDDKNKAKEYIDTLPGHMEVKPYKKTRSNQQNRALHLFFSFICEALNELGLEFTFVGLKGLEFQVMYTPSIVKEFIWKPIQFALFETNSTRDLKTKQIDRIIDVLTKFFGEQGTEINFPSSFGVYCEIVKDKI